MTSGTFSDVHEARRASEELRALQARFARAIDGANDGIWERNLDTDHFYLSDRFDEILGYPPGGLPRERRAWLELIHPDDLANHLSSVAHMLRERTATMWEVRFRTAGGSYRWLRMRGIAAHGPDGKVVMTSGTASDIHDAKLAEHELKRHRDHLAELVEERTVGLERARLEAEAAREASERANLAKSEFLANMSHELRTPMHAIISFANFGVEKSSRAERDKLLHYFGNIQKSANRLLALLNDLLDLSKLEAGKMIMSFNMLDARVLIDEAITETEALARANGVELQVSAMPVVVRADNLRLLQVLRNLLSNAIKFTPRGGTVTVACERQGGSLELRVSDTGIGIPEDELEQVFDKFVQSSKTKTGAGGTGLGLAISREIVGAHGGSIVARNNPPPACGATFVMRLPLGNEIAHAPAGKAAAEAAT